MTKNITLRIYVACLASYNAGILYGKWIDANQQPEDIETQVRAMLATSPIPQAEEWAIHDSEGFYSCSVSEWTGFAQVSELAAFIEQHDRLGAELVSHFGDDLHSAQQAIEDNYCGEYESLADFAEELTADTLTIPAQLVYYIDYEAMARDMELNGDVFTIELGFKNMHVFWNR